uniref:Uncharacterized protein n=1 Tax=Oryza barthii TaxID=65489 RepID=A0A0D3ERG4_9ORYZ
MGSMGAFSPAHVDATQAGVHASWRGSTCLGRWYTAGALNGGEDVWLQIPEIPHRAIGPEEGEADPKTDPPKCSVISGPGTENIFRPIKHPMLMHTGYNQRGPWILFNVWRGSKLINDSVNRSEQPKASLPVIRPPKPIHAYALPAASKGD